MSDIFSPFQVEQWKALHSIGISPIALYNFLRQVADAENRNCAALLANKNYGMAPEKIRQSLYFLRATSALCMNMFIPSCCQATFDPPYPPPIVPVLVKAVDDYREKFVDAAVALVSPEYLDARKNMRSLIFENVMIPENNISWNFNERYAACIKYWKICLADLQMTENALDDDAARHVRIFLQMLYPEVGRN